MEGTICGNQKYGEHIIVRCPGCGSRHSTKNIGFVAESGKVHPARTIFDIVVRPGHPYLKNGEPVTYDLPGHPLNGKPMLQPDRCRCSNPAATGLVHVCSEDDITIDSGGNIARVST